MDFVWLSLVAKEGIVLIMAKFPNRYDTGGSEFRLWMTGRVGLFICRFFSAVLIVLMGCHETSLDIRNSTAQDVRENVAWKRSRTCVVPAVEM